MRPSAHPFQRSLLQRTPAVLLLVALMAVAGGCTSPTEPGSADGAAVGPEDTAADTTAAPGAPVDRDLRLPVVHLGVTDWTGARVNAAIAEQLIERRLGYPVEAVDVTDTISMLDQLARGELDAVLEVWPSSLEAADRAIIEAGRVDELGPLGVEGRIGWFVPRYVAEGELAVTGWEALADPAVARAFATATTSPRGRFVGTDPANDEVDEELIEALGLPFQVEYSGSDEATAATVDAAVESGQPVLLFWWSPTALVARHDLVPVELPERTADCVAAFEAGGLLGCDYPRDRLVKLGAPDLSTRAPELDRFLRAFELSSEDQLALIDRIDNHGTPIEEAAAAWIEANGDRWERWLG